MSYVISLWWLFGQFMDNMQGEGSNGGGCWGVQMEGSTGHCTTTPICDLMIVAEDKGCRESDLRTLHEVMEKM